MTPVFPARRRAEEFAALVEDTSTRGSGDARFTDLLETVELLRDAPAVEARPEFVASLRERLLVAAESALSPSPAQREIARLTLPPRRTSRDRRIAAAVGGLALVGATTSMAMAAQGALPGDVLYPIKRAMENAQTGVAVGEGQKGRSLLSSAAGRLDEVSALSRGGDLEDTLAIEGTLNDFTDQATEASDLLLSNFADSGHEDSIAELRDFTASSLDQLTTLESLVPTEARDELMNAAHVLFQIDAAAHQACPSCGGAGIAEIPPVFAPVSSGFDQATAGSPVSQTPGQQQDGPKDQSQHPQVPEVQEGDLPPGSVLDPPDDGDPTTPGGGGGTDPIDSLTQGLTDGAGGVSQPTSNPSLPDVGGVLEDAEDPVDDLTDPLLP